MFGSREWFSYKRCSELLGMGSYEKQLSLRTSAKLKGQTIFITLATS